MERAAKKGGHLKGMLGAFLVLGILATACPGSQAQGATERGANAAELPAVAKECGEAKLADTPLPNSAQALQQRKKLKILAIGASSASVVGPLREGSSPLLEQILEHTIKGLDVEIIDRGFSGELAAAAATRLKIEVALNHPDIVLWQVGTNDALAQVPVEQFQEAVGDMVRWLKEHNIDVILVGLHYMKRLVRDPHYQAIRTSLRSIAAKENVPRITRYEAMEIISRAMREPGRPVPSEFGLTEAGYNCMAQYVARAIAVGLYAKPPKTAPPPVR
ncbi:MAG: SGNH/GDSL hydrolase family protein [Hyphomicrobiaceae bacterium]|nr:MAG: SGNH/GDSL hydrolase family protein [Hyphomicrobiaceae bacterium]